MQDGVALEADGVDVALRLQHLIKLRHGEGRVSAKDPHQVTAPIPRYDRGQNVLPVVSAVDIALAQGATLKIAELVEHEQRVIALAAKVAVSCRAVLIPRSGAGRTVHVQSDPLGRLQTGVLQKRMIRAKYIRARLLMRRQRCCWDKLK